MDPDKTYFVCTTEKYSHGHGILLAGHHDKGRLHPEHCLVVEARQQDPDLLLRFENFGFGVGEEDEHVEEYVSDHPITTASTSVNGESDPFYRAANLLIEVAELAAQGQGEMMNLVGESDDEYHWKGVIDPAYKLRETVLDWSAALTFRRTIPPRKRDN